MDDEFKKQFRAARAQNAIKKHTKTKNQSTSKRDHVQKTRPEAEEDTKSMPPPPPRSTIAAKSPSPPIEASYHADSQGTILFEGGIASSSPLIHPSEPSVNKNSQTQKQQPNTSIAASNPTPSIVADNPFSTQGSTGTNNNNPIDNTAVLPSMSHARGIRSVEGSSGGLYDENRSESMNAADLATSALSIQNTEDRFASSQAVPAGIYQSSIATSTDTHAAVVLSSSIHQEEDENRLDRGRDGGLPTDFFDEKTKGIDKKDAKKKDDGADEEFANFLQEIKVVEATVTAAVDEDEEKTKQDREDFEHFVRMERLQELKEAASDKKENKNKEQEQTATALELAGLVAEVEKPVIKLQKKRKIADTIKLLENIEEDDGSDRGEEEEEEDDDLMSWRAKKTAAK